MARETNLRLAAGLLRASFVNGTGVLLLAAASLFRDTLILRTFGLSARTDAFFLALLIPTVLASVLSSSIQVRRSLLPTTEPWQKGATAVELRRRSQRSTC